MDTKTREEKSSQIPEDMLNTLNNTWNEGNTTKMASALSPGGEVDLLLVITIALCKTGMDRHSEMTKIFIERTLARIFKWVHDEYDVIKRERKVSEVALMERIEQLIQLIVIKLPDDCLPLLNLLAITFNPMSRFYIHHEARAPRTRASGTERQNSSNFAASEDANKPRGMFVDMINTFGYLGGFKIVLEKFQKSTPTIPVIAALLRPFGQCYELLTRETVETYFTCALDKTCQFLNELTDEELSEFCESPDLAISDTKPDAINTILLALEAISSRLPPGNETYSNMELFRMRMTLRLKRARDLPYGRGAHGLGPSEATKESEPVPQSSIISTFYTENNGKEQPRVTEHGRLSSVESAEDCSCHITEVNVTYTGFTGADTAVEALPPCDYDNENDNDQDSVAIECDVDVDILEGANGAQAMPKEHGERFSSHFDISPMQESTSRYTRASRWSANSSDISGSTSKSQSVRGGSHDLCRFCYELEQSTGNRMIKPCNCSGSAAYVHTKCLKKWIHFSRNTQCEVCHTHFTYIPYSERVRAFLEEFRKNKRWRNATFATLVGLVVLLYLVIFAVFPGGIIDV
ncbi:uncharacterized protein [Ptychodera flava]|uniref:uncharacterized protein n=1 Tax=Ptychodera flava TaxID=63121 RepID=UPI00396A479A